MEIGIFRSCYGEGEGVGISYGSELIVNGGFDTDSIWAKQAGWTIGGGVLVGNTNPSTSVYQTNVSVRSGGIYRLEYDIVSWTSGYVLGAIRGNYFFNRNSVGHFVQDLKLLIFNGDTAFYLMGLFTGSVDNVSLREVFGDMGTSSVGGEILL